MKGMRISANFVCFDIAIKRIISKLHQAAKHEVKIPTENFIAICFSVLELLRSYSTFRDQSLLQLWKSYLTECEKKELHHRFKRPSVDENTILQ